MRARIRYKVDVGGVPSHVPEFSTVHFNVDRGGFPPHVRESLTIVCHTGEPQKAKADIRLRLEYSDNVFLREW